MVDAGVGATRRRSTCRRRPNCQELERLRHRGDDPFAERLDVAAAGDSGLDDAELVAPEPRDNIGAAHQCGQPPGELADQIVAGRMSKRIVDVLEAVDVEIEECKLRALAPRFGQRAVEAVVEQGAVRQTGQRHHGRQGAVLALR